MTAWPAAASPEAVPSAAVFGAVTATSEPCLHPHPAPVGELIGFPSVRAKGPFSVPFLPVLCSGPTSLSLTGTGLKHKVFKAMEIHGHRAAVLKLAAAGLGPLSVIPVTFKTPELPFRVATLLMEFLDLIMVDITLNICTISL